MKGRIFETASPVDVLIIGYSFFMIILITVFGGHLNDRQTIYFAYAACIAAAALFIFLKSTLNYRIIEYLSLIYPLTLLIIFYEISGYHIHLFFPGFFDRILVGFENLIFPVHPTVWFQRWNHPLITEWMMFGYSFYLLLLPITVSWLYFRKKKTQSHHLLLSLIIAFFICYIGFFLFPIEGPRYYLHNLYTVKFTGYFFKSITDLIEGEAMLHGGCFPSAHCAAATVMLLLSFRYDKLLFAWTAPIIITLFTATVYGRYHYPSDFAAGFVVGAAAIRLATALQNYWDKKIKRNSGTIAFAQSETGLSRPEADTLAKRP